MATNWPNFRRDFLYLASQNRYQVSLTFFPSIPKEKRAAKEKRREEAKLREMEQKRQEEEKMQHEMQLNGGHHNR
jgi:hypothetical protein